MEDDYNKLMELEPRDYGYHEVIGGDTGGIYPRELRERAIRRNQLPKPLPAQEYETEAGPSGRNRLILLVVAIALALFLLKR